MVTDEYGTDPTTLRFKETTLQINALTMISKRLERDEPVSVQRLLDTTRELLTVNQKRFRRRSLLQVEADLVMTSGTPACSPYTA
jgi:hypothetical protein